MLLNSTPGRGASTVTSKVKLTLLPASMLRPTQVINPAASDPPLLIFEIPLKPLGTASSTDTPVASLGPALLTSIVKVTTSPTLGSASLTVLIKLMSATCGSTGSLSASSSSSLSGAAGSGSTLPSFGLVSSGPISPSPSGSGPLPGVLSSSN